MLDPRIYRTGLMVVVLAVFVLAFSLENQPGPLSTTLAPQAYNTGYVSSLMTRLASTYPIRDPGSAGDDALGTYVGQQLSSDGLSVSTSTFRGRTVDGTRTLETVTGTLAGISPGSIVVVSHRDALGSQATAALSGTAAMLGLAQVLSGETHHHSIVLESISGSDGSAGAEQLARSLPGPIDAVIVLGDLAGTHIRYPIVVPWSDGQAVAPPVLRNTLAAAVSTQAGMRSGGTSLASELSHLAFPLAVSEQGPFGSRGDPAVLLSLSSERAPAADEPISQPNLAALGTSVLQTVNALDAGPPVPAPSAYLLFDGKVVPGWAMRLFVLALIIPVLVATIDGIARARRRGHEITRWVVWVLAAAVPFLLAVLVVLGARIVGLLDIAPPGAVRAGAVPIGGSGTTVLIAVLVVIVLGLVALRPLVIGLVGGEPRKGHRSGEASNAGAGAAVLLVMCVVTVLIWLQNPFAAALMVLALHLWMWVVDPDVLLPRPLLPAMLAIGLAPAALVVVYYALSLGLSPVGLIWNGVLLIAGGQLGATVALEWSVILGCLVSVVVIALQARRQTRPEELPITVRGPIGYAGPGSLGGTQSALRRLRS
jgi:hypothetical protein